MSDDWLTEVAKALEVDQEVVDREALLLLARDVAHSVERKAAPLSAFVVGYAAGARGADSSGVGHLIEQIRAMCPPNEATPD